MSIALQSLNFPDRFIRHANFLGELTTVTTDLDRQDASFNLVAGLADARLVSFASHNFGNHVLRHENFRMKLHDRTGTGDTPLLRQDATFVVMPGLADPTAVSFRSLNFPDRFLRHRDFHLFLEPADSDLARHDATFRMVPGFLPHFTFDAGIAAGDRARLIARHRAALASVAACNRLTGDEKLRLIETYGRSIHHGITTAPRVNASATVGGTTISVNFGVLFPQGDDAISQTLIHEMMHCAGFRHPARRDPPAGRSCAASPDPNLFDCPNDNGQYFGTPPLRAEFCIAGDQDDLMTRAGRKTASERCVIDADGVATLHVD